MKCCDLRLIYQHLIHVVSASEPSSSEEQYFHELECQGGDSNP